MSSCDAAKEMCRQVRFSPLLRTTGSDLPTISLPTVTDWTELTNRLFLTQIFNIQGHVEGDHQQEN